MVLVGLQVTGSINEEDPGIWRDHRGNFHAIFHGPGHAWSTDGLQWSFVASRSIIQSESIEPFSPLLFVYPLSRVIGPILRPTEKCKVRLYPEMAEYI